MPVTSSLAVMDYGMGNLRSVANAVRKVAPDVEVIVTSQPEHILQADRIIFPGVGAIRDCMAGILAAGFDQVIAEVSQSKPVLAICVGMQALLTNSEENNGVPCLNHLPGEVKLFPGGVDNNGAALKVPHMGWNTVRQGSHPLWQGIEDDSRFYFVHSYYVMPDEVSLLAGLSDYGVPFAAALAKDNLFATQFHPEKSHTAGLQLLSNFVQWSGEC